MHQFIAAVRRYLYLSAARSCVSLSIARFIEDALGYSLVGGRLASRQVDNYLHSLGSEKQKSDNQLERFQIQLMQVIDT